MRIQIDVLGERQVNRTLERYIGVSGNMEVAFEEIHDYLLAVEKKQFETQGASSGNPWKELAESTKAYKEREGLDPRILHATLDLRKSLTDAGDPGHVKYITPTMMVFGTQVPYAKYHQTPSDVSRRRRPIDLTEENKVAMVKMIQRFLRSAKFAL